MGIHNSLTYSLPVTTHNHLPHVSAGAPLCSYEKPYPQSLDEATYSRYQEMICRLKPKELANLKSKLAELSYEMPAKIRQLCNALPKPLEDEKGRPIVCPTCQGSAYLGRIAAFELLEIDGDLRKLIASGGSLTQIKAAARKNKMLYLQEQALQMVMEGITSVQEIIRVTRGAKSKAER